MPMSALYGFCDGGSRRRATVRMDNGDPVNIVVSDAGVSVSSPRFGILGRRLYRTDTFEEAAVAAHRLESMCNGHLTPPGMEDPLLKTFTRAVLHCSTVAEVSEVLNGEVEPAGLDGVAVAAPTGSEGLA